MLAAVIIRPLDIDRLRHAYTTAVPYPHAVEADLRLVSALGQRARVMDRPLVRRAGEARRHEDGAAGRLAAGGEPLGAGFGLHAIGSDAGESGMADPDRDWLGLWMTNSLRIVNPDSNARN